MLVYIADYGLSIVSDPAHDLFYRVALGAQAVGLGRMGCTMA